jgi:hypothetical protein
VCSSLAVTVAVVIAGCGGGGAPTRPAISAATDVARIEAVSRARNRAVASHLATVAFAQLGPCSGVSQGVQRPEKFATLITVVSSELMANVSGVNYAIDGGLIETT